MRSIVWFCENVLHRQYLFAAQCASDWLVGLVQEISARERGDIGKEVYDTLQDEFTV